MKNITINCNNEYIVNNLPNSIEQISLGIYFTLPLVNLPNSVKKIIFIDSSFESSNYNEKLDCLPNSIAFIELPFNYKHKLNNLPSSLITIKCNKYYNYIDDDVMKKYNIETFETFETL